MTRLSTVDYVIPYVRDLELDPDGHVVELSQALQSASER